MKKIGIGFLCLVVVLGMGGYFLFSNLDYIIKTTIIRYASQATQVKVGLDSVKLALSTGDGSLNNLSVGNPKGFSSANAFYLGTVGIKVDTSTIRGTGPIVISKVVIDKPQVNFELFNNGSSNLQTIQNNTQAYANSFQSDTGAPAQPANAPKQPGRKIIITDLIIQNGHVSITQEMLKGKQLGTNLPDIHLTNIGKSTGGATGAQVAQQIFSAITSSAAKSSVAELAKEKISGVLQAVPAASIGKAAVGTVGSQLKGVFSQ